MTQESQTHEQESASAMTFKDKIGGKARQGKDKAAELSAKTKSGFADAKQKASARADSARKQASEAYGKTREKSSALYNDGKNKANAGFERSKKQVESTPLAVLAGGLALGALVAAVIPESSRERRVMGSTGRRINDRAKEAANAAKARGTEKIDELGLNTEALKKQMEDFVTKGVEILKSAGKAAGEAAAKKE